MSGSSDSGALFEDLRWPTDVNLVDPRDPERRFFGTAVWRQDYQTYAVLVDGFDRWIGDRHGQFPTIGTLCRGLGDENLEVFDDSVDSLHGLAAIAESTLRADASGTRTRPHHREHVARILNKPPPTGTKQGRHTQDQVVPVTPTPPAPKPPGECPGLSR